MKIALRTKNEERLEQIKAAGQHIIDNAETILGAEKYRAHLSVVIDFPCHEPPTITVHREVYPDKYIEGLSHGGSC